MLRLRVGLLDDGEGDVIEKKTGKARRIVVNETLCRLYLEYRSAHGIILWAPTAPLAETNRGGCLDTRELLRFIADACAAIGLRGNYGSHSMRKSFATELYRQTGSVAIVQNLLRHGMPATTLAYIDGLTEAPPEPPERQYSLSELYNLVAFD